MCSALGYVELAEKVNGRIRHPVDFAYIWGDALGAFQRASPDLHIINLETAVTTSEDAWPNKGIHYRMHPANLPLPYRRRHRLLRARQQPRFGLGLQRSSGNLG